MGLSTICVYMCMFTDDDDGPEAGPAGKGRRRTWQRTKLPRRRTVDEEQQRAGGCMGGRLALSTCSLVAVCVHRMRFPSMCFGLQSPSSPVGPVVAVPAHSTLRLPAARVWFRGGGKGGGRGGGGRAAWGAAAAAAWFSPAHGGCARLADGVGVHSGGAWQGSTCC